MLLITLVSPAFGVALLVSHVLTLELEIPQGVRAYRRMMHLLTIIGLMAIVLVIPEWTKYTSELAMTRGQTPLFLTLTTANWQSTVVTRMLLVLIPPVSVWCFRQAPFYFAPILFAFSLVSLPALLAGCLVLREVRSRHQRNVDPRK